MPSVDQLHVSQVIVVAGEFLALRFPPDVLVHVSEEVLVSVSGRCENKHKEDISCCRYCSTVVSLYSSF